MNETTVGQEHMADKEGGRGAVIFFFFLGGGGGRLLLFDARPYTL